MLAPPCRSSRTAADTACGDYQGEAVLDECRRLAQALEPAAR